MANIQRRDQLPAEGSVYEVANAQSREVAMVLADVDAIALFDISGSMSGDKFVQAGLALDQLQKKFRGKLAIIEFDMNARWRLNGRPSSPNGSTNLTAALELAKPFDGTGIRFIVISDGAPDNRYTAQEVAATFEDPIDSVFIGPDHDISGKLFLEGLSALKGGKSMGQTDVKELEARVTKLLTEKNEN